MYLSKYTSKPQITCTFGVMFTFVTYFPVARVIGHEVLERRRHGAVGWRSGTGRESAVVLAVCVPRPGGTLGVA